MIKFFAWEISFGDKISGIRNTELKAMRRSMTFRAITGFLWGFVPTLVSLVSFAIFVLAGNTLTAEVAFSALCTDFLEQDHCYLVFILRNQNISWMCIVFLLVDDHSITL